ncbi:hypothetical protein HNY73_023180 [Argiope bruennichi]|uniref:Uncharacterized protein n=1 Tax=Argiope bruennichi TaxID=94029 RepID=A0A8T0E3A8_ARGBR|nr:hypothetical protein HNY73_023180 [Argiope bruennichi]
MLDPLPRRRPLHRGIRVFVSIFQHEDYLSGCFCPGRRTRRVREQEVPQAGRLRIGRMLFPVVAHRRPHMHEAQAERRPLFDGGDSGRWKIPVLLPLR